MLEFVERAAAVDTFTLVIVAILSGWAGVLTLHVLSRTVLSLIFVPGFTFGALATNYFFELSGFFPTHDRETNVVIACTVGIIIALLMLLLFLRFSSIIGRIRTERYQFRHDVQKDVSFRRELRGT